jgi:hypothetical protein
MFGNFLLIYLVPFLLFLFQDGSGGGTEGARDTGVRDSLPFSPIIILIVAILALIIVAIVGLPFVMNYRRMARQNGKDK